MNRTENKVPDAVLSAAKTTVMECAALCEQREAKAKELEEVSKKANSAFLAAKGDHERNLKNLFETILFVANQDGGKWLKTNFHNLLSLGAFDSLCAKDGKGGVVRHWFVFDEAIAKIQKALEVNDD